MAIEFNCQYCSALIRVPDSAGGGKGRCPRCAKRIKVPKVSTVKSVAPPPAAPPPVAPPLVAPPLVEEPAEPERPREIENFFDPDYDPRKAARAAQAEVIEPQEPGFGEFPAALPAVRPSSVAMKLKQKKGSGAWVIALGFCLILCGVGGWYYWQQIQGELLGGELTAETAERLELIPGLIEKSSIKLPSDDLDEVLTNLEKLPVPLLSSLMQVQFRGSNKGVLVYLNAGQQSRFYRVNVRGNAPLTKYQTKNAADLEQQRLKEIDKAATAFASEYQKVLAKKVDQGSLTSFRNTLALPVLVRGLGNQIVAAHGRTIYPCVYEDHEGGLYFLLPPDITEFELSGRKYENGAVVFPAIYQVKVVGKIKVPPGMEKQEEPASKSKSKKGPVFKGSDESDEKMDSKDDGEMKKDE